MRVGLTTLIGPASSPAKHREEPPPATSSSLLQRRYLECLWLGEAYFPLAAFPLLFRAILEGHLITSDGCSSDKHTCASRLWLAITELLLPAGAVQSRYRQKLPRAVDSMICSDPASQTQEVDSTEEQVLRAALNSGPAAIVGNEIRQSIAKREEALRQRESLVESQLELPESQQDRPAIDELKTPLKDEWLAAIERRELSLQILLVFEAIRLIVEFPSILTEASASLDSAGPSRPSIAPLQATSPTAQTASDSQLPLETQDALTEEGTKKKRKRKAGTARRWTGFPTGSASFGNGDNGFPWAKRPSRAGETSNSLQDEDGEDREDEKYIDAAGRRTLASDPEKLHRRLETLADRLSVRILSADLAKDGDLFDLDEPLSSIVAAEGSEAASNTRKSDAKTKPALLFGTSARFKDEGDERDELVHLSTDIIDPTYSRLLFRQCSMLRSRALTSMGPAMGATPARSRSSVNIIPSPASVERRKKKEDSSLASLRKDADLVAKRQKAEEKAKAREAIKVAQRPALKDALVIEEQKARKGRAVSTAADAERNKREVSVRRRVGFARTESTSSAFGATDESQLEEGQGPGLKLFAGVSNRLNKRKLSEPQRFGGLAGTSQHSGRSHSDGISQGSSQGRLDDDVDNPFRDVRNTLSDSQSQTLLPPPNALPTKKPFTRVTSAFSRLSSKTTSAPSTAQESQQSLGDGSQTSTTAPDDTFWVSNRASTNNKKRLTIPGGSSSSQQWQRTESQPVTMRDLSELASLSSETFKQGVGPTEPEVLDLGAIQDLEEEEEEEEEMFVPSKKRPILSTSFPSTRIPAIPTVTRDDDEDDDQAQPSLSGLRSFTKTTSFSTIAPDFREGPARPAHRSSDVDPRSSPPTIVASPVDEDQRFLQARPPLKRALPSGRNPFAKGLSSGSLTKAVDGGQQHVEDEE